MLMDEWSEYIKNCEINDGTLLGKSLAFEVSDDQKAASQAKLGGGKGKAAAPAAKGKKAVKGKAAAPAKGGAKGKAAAPAAKGAAKGAAKTGAAAKKSGGGGGGRIEDLDRDVAVKCIESSGLHVTDGTEDLSDFLAVFAPCSEKSDQGEWDACMRGWMGGLRRVACRGCWFALRPRVATSPPVRALSRSSSLPSTNAPLTPPRSSVPSLQARRCARLTSPTPTRTATASAPSPSARTTSSRCS